MIRNIPNKYDQKLLLKTFDPDFKNLYDFFYLPIDFKVRLSLKLRISATWVTHLSIS